MTGTKQLFQTGMTVPGLDNYESQTRSALEVLERQTLAGATHLTKYNLNSNGTYTTYTIDGAINPQGQNANNFPLPNKGKYTYTLYTGDVLNEGDRILDQNGDLYDVHNKVPYWMASQFDGYQAELYLLQTVTHRLRTSASAYTYTETDIYMNLAPRGQTSINPQEYYGPYDYVGVTASDVYEGDEVEDLNGDIYTVMQVTLYPSARADFAFNWKICVLVKQFPTATLNTLTLGNYDSVTGLPAQSYAASTIYAQVFSPGKIIIKTPAGYYGKYDYIALTSAAVLEGDQIVQGGVTFEVNQVTSYPTARTDIALTWKVLGLTKRDFAEQPATSGTWHQDSNSVGTDPRNRLKVTVDTYYTAGNVKLDNNSTNASTITCFDGATYPITRVFLTKAIDAAAVINREQGTPHYTDKLLGRKPYATTERGTIDVYAVNKSGVTASNLCEKYENEIKRILTTYDPYANVKDLDTIKPELTDLGYGFLYHTKIAFDYKRSNDDYVAALPTITYGDNQASTYYFPNATEISFNDPNGGEIKLASLGRVGEIPQNTFTPVFTITIKCDIDINAASNKRWKRPQSSSAITDTIPDQVFREIRIGNKNNSAQAYQNLNWGGGTTIPVRLESIDLTASVLTLVFSRYSATSGNSSTAAQWYGYT